MLGFASMEIKAERMIKRTRMTRKKMSLTAAAVVVVLLFLAAGGGAAAPRRILVDTDMDTDDILALLYILKQNRAEFDVKGITINANEWSDAGHAVNHLYDLLFMMGRDDIPVGAGGDGAISDAGVVHPDVGGYLPLIDQGTSTAGGCRYREAIPAGRGGRLDVDTNSGVRRGFLPQGSRRYRPLRQPTAQRVMVDTVSAGPTTVFLLGSHTNLALLLMARPELKRNIDRVYVSGGGVRSADPTGNLFTAYATNPFAEFNIFGDPFAAYQVLHSGIPITMIPLDATNTIPVTEEFFSEFRHRQITYEAQYCFQSLDQVLKRQRKRSSHGNTGYYMWDPFAAGVAISSMRNGENDGENDFAELEYMNITVITSNKPYGERDGSNPFFDGRATPKFGLKDGGVHSGHVQTGIRDHFCLVPGSNRGRCEDGYTREVSGPEGVRVRVATSAKANKDNNSSLDKEFFKSFLQVLNLPEQSGRFSVKTQFPYYREVLHKPVFTNGSRGKPVIFDMDMSPGDFVSLIYLLKAPREVIDLKGVLVNGNGWANLASIDIVYDILHMMGRDDIPVGQGNTTALGSSSLGCNNSYAIPHGSGGFVDSDTLYGLARSLPRSPRRYIPQSTDDDPERRQPLALEVWQSVRKQLGPGQKMTVLTNGPLTNIANISLSDRDASSVIERVYVVGGLIRDGDDKKGNVFTVPSNKYAEFNMFLDPLAAKTVIESNLTITLIPLTVQRKAASFDAVLGALQDTQPTPESKFVHGLFSLLHELQRQKLYHHVDIFLGEVLGAVYMVEGSALKPSVKQKKISVVANTRKIIDGDIVISKHSAKLVNVLTDFDSEMYSKRLANSLVNRTLSAVIGSFEEQKAIWSRPPKNLGAWKYRRIGNILLV